MEKLYDYYLATALNSDINDIIRVGGLQMSLMDKVLKSVSDNTSAIRTEDGTTQGLDPKWTCNRRIVITNTPDNLEELMNAVDVKDPGSVAAYFVYSVMCLTADYNTGISMMKYLFADLEPFGRGFTEGGVAGRAGWDSCFDERLKDDEYRWLPRAYFVGASADNGFHPAEPLAIELHYNKPNTEAINSQTLEQLGRLNIVYYVQSNAAGNKVNIELSRFDGSDRFYVTKGSASVSLFYDQRSALTASARAKLWE